MRQTLAISYMHYIFTTWMLFYFVFTYLMTKYDTLLKPDFQFKMFKIEKTITFYKKSNNLRYSEQ